MFALTVPVQAQNIQQMDPYTGSRTIPNIATGGTTTLSSSEIIDIVILGDGYLSGENTTFFNHAQDWYDRIFDPVDGIRPFSFFPEAFRVRANFKSSSQRASGPDDSDRQSYYKVKLNCSTNCGVYIDSSWWNDSDTVNETFRDRVFDAIDEVSPLNTTQYPSSLAMSDQADVHSHLVAVLLIRRNSDGNQPGGVTVNIPRTSGTRIVRSALGVGWEHEFAHAFSYVKDEYIHDRGSTATDSNPLPADRSIFNVRNLTYSNDRCDLLWPHLAPGGQYNSNVNSLIGNLFKGGKRYENGVWHSEYSCLINGTHHNYLCDVDPASPDTNLRDHEHFYFWCEEIVAWRILEKTGEFWRGGDPADINARGRTWYQRWVNTLRDDYYTHFDVPTLIREKNACYDTFYGKACPPEFPNCMDACDRGHIPACLHACTIREVGNAMYVDSGFGGSQDGSRWNPYDDIPTAISQSHAECPSPNLIIIKPDSYPDTIDYDTRSTWLADGCSTTDVGD